MIETYLDFCPEVDPSAFVHEMAYLCGEVTVGARVSIWPTAVLRGDQGRIIVGDDSNIQDGSVVHCTGGISVTEIGQRVTVGHRAVVHGCKVEDDCLIGMGSVIMDNAVIGTGSIVGAGAIVVGDTLIPPGSLVLGAPARVVRPISSAHAKWILHSWETYVRLGQQHTASRTGESG